MGQATMGWNIVNLRDENGAVVEGKKRFDLTASDILSLIREAAIRFVVAYSRTDFRWIDLADCYKFWKDEVKAHHCKGDRIYLEDYPGEYCYVASEWQLESGERMIVLEIYH